MNPLPECCFPHSAPIPHQFVMKVYVDAWIYVTEKFVNMGNIELYEGVLRYEKADYPPIPSFIFLHISFIYWRLSTLKKSFTPFLHHFVIVLYDTIVFELLYAANQGIICCMDIPIHCGFDAGVSQQLLQHFRLHSAFHRTGCIGVIPAASEIPLLPLPLGFSHG